MKRSSKVLTTFITAAITFGTLVAVAGDKKKGYDSSGCHHRQWHHNHNTEQDKPAQPTISPAKK